MEKTIKKFSLESTPLLLTTQDLAQDMSDFMDRHGKYAFSDIMLGKVRIKYQKGFTLNIRNEIVDKVKEYHPGMNRPEEANLVDYLSNYRYEDEEQGVSYQEKLDVMKNLSAETIYTIINRTYYNEGINNVCHEIIYFGRKKVKNDWLYKNDFGPLNVDQNVNDRRAVNALLRLKDILKSKSTPLADIMYETINRKFDNIKNKLPPQ